MNKTSIGMHRRTVISTGVGFLCGCASASEEPPTQTIVGAPPASPAPPERAEFGAEQFARESPWRQYILGELAVSRTADGVIVTPGSESAVSQMMGHTGRGYDLNSYLTEPIEYGEGEFLTGRGSPRTMCVGAVYEALARAITIANREPENWALTQEMGDGLGLATISSRMFKAWMFSNPHANMPREKNGRRYGVVLEFADGRKEDRPDRAKSSGPADALVLFGIGGRVLIGEAQPGDFISFNRASGSGHAGIIVRFINSDGSYADRFEQSETVGFLYFSSQESTNGLAFREEYFSSLSSSLCNRASAGGCRVVRGDDGESLAVARLMPPEAWTASSESTGRRLGDLDAGTVSISDIQAANYRRRYGRGLGLMLVGRGAMRLAEAEAELEDVELTAGLNISE